MILKTIILLPLLGAIINGFFGNRLSKPVVSLVGVASVLIPFLLILILGNEFLATKDPIEAVLLTWFQNQSTTLNIALYVDELSLLMGLIVLGIGSLIHIYSIGYMWSDESFARFFSYLNIFIFFMLLLILGKNLLVLFMGWEGVGLASYLLIGFWYKEKEKAAAASKAFLINRIGDIFFIAAMFAIFYFVGTLDFQTINSHFQQQPNRYLEIIGILLFLGAAGKSAQMPLYVWLPDAMAGPTPVSALIHAATMVTAGVYLIARMHGFFELTPITMTVIGIVAGLTALLSALIALFQSNIKKILAYSTISQLAYMFMALSSGAYISSIFHLYTHAFFKALLFLAAGAVIHALHGEEDIFKMYGLRKKLPLITVLFLIGTLAITGIPPFAGFFSKDEILFYTLNGKFASPLVFGMAALTAFLTSIYMFRLFVIAFLTKDESHNHEHLHQSFSMNIVLVLLAGGSTLAGFTNLPAMLGRVLTNFQGREIITHHEIEFLSVTIAIVGAIIAFILFSGKRERGAKLAKQFEKLTYLPRHKFLVDELYAATFGKSYTLFSTRVLNDGSEKFVFTLSPFIAKVTKQLSLGFSKVSSGELSFYLFFILCAITFTLLWSFYHG